MRDKIEPSGYPPPRFSYAHRERVMAGSAEKVLADKKIELPKAAAPVANYVPVVMAGGLAFVSGQVPVWNGEFKFIGRPVQGYTTQPRRPAPRTYRLDSPGPLRCALLRH